MTTTVPFSTATTPRIAPKPDTVTYAAVPDPDDRRRMTFWRRDHRGRLRPWPHHARYGPRVVLADLPADRQERREIVLSSVRSVITPYLSAVEAAIDADLHLAAARFAGHTGRCCACPRRLQNNTDKVAGLCVVCRHQAPADLVTAMTEATSRLRVTR